MRHCVFGFVFRLYVTPNWFPHDLNQFCRHLVELDLPNLKESCDTGEVCAERTNWTEESSVSLF